MHIWSDMWTHRFTAEAPLPPTELWPVLANIQNWPAVDENIESIEAPALPKAGDTFRLKPKGGPTLSLTIGDFEPPHLYSDIARMPLAAMKTVHRLAPAAGGTTICVEITIEGPLAGLWGLIVGRKHASGLARQTERFIAAANRLR